MLWQNACNSIGFVNKLLSENFRNASPHPNPAPFISQKCPPRSPIIRGELDCPRVPHSKKRFTQMLVTWRVWNCDSRVQRPWRTRYTALHQFSSKTQMVGCAALQTLVQLNFIWIERTHLAKVLNRSNPWLHSNDWMNSTYDSSGFQLTDLVHLMIQAKTWFCHDSESTDDSTLSCIYIWNWLDIICT